MAMVTKHLDGVRNPLQQTRSASEAATADSSDAGGGQGGPFYMVVETQGSNAEHDQQKLEGFLEVGDC